MVWNTCDLIGYRIMAIWRHWDSRAEADEMPLDFLSPNEGFGLRLLAGNQAKPDFWGSAGDRGSPASRSATWRKRSTAHPAAVRLPQHACCRCPSGAFSSGCILLLSYLLLTPSAMSTTYLRLFITGISVIANLLGYPAEHLRPFFR